MSRATDVGSGVEFLATPRRRISQICLCVVHLDVAALDVATPGVRGVGAPKEFDGEEVPGELSTRASRLTLVAHQNRERALRHVFPEGKRHVGILRSVGALEFCRRNTVERRPIRRVAPNNSSTASPHSVRPKNTMSFTVPCSLISG